jgi:integral membrane protein
MSHFVVKWVARLEGLSFLLLVFVAMPIKYGLGEPLPVRILGGVHGFLFLGWLLLLALAARRERWPAALTWLGFITSMIPMGFVFFERAAADHATGEGAVRASDG